MKRIHKLILGALGLLVALASQQVSAMDNLPELMGFKRLAVKVPQRTPSTSSLDMLRQLENMALDGVSNLAEDKKKEFDDLLTFLLQDLSWWGKEAPRDKRVERVERLGGVIKLSGDEQMLTVFDGIVNQAKLSWHLEDLKNKQLKTAQSPRLSQVCAMEERLSPRGRRDSQGSTLSVSSGD